MAFGWVSREQFERVERENELLRTEVKRLNEKLEAELRAQIVRPDAQPVRLTQPFIAAQPQAVAQVLEMPTPESQTLKKAETGYQPPRVLSGMEVVGRAMAHRNAHRAATK